jgi:hypothetical protein
MLRDRTLAEKSIATTVIASIFGSLSDWRSKDPFAVVPGDGGGEFVSAAEIARAIEASGGCVRSFCTTATHPPYCAMG